MFCLLETAPSFEQISQSITGLLLDSNAAAAGDGCGDDAAAECADELLTSAALSSDYQQMSTWCWVNIRVSCDGLLCVLHSLHQKCNVT